MGVMTSGVAGTMPGTSTPSRRAVRFPSVEWFEALGDVMGEQRSHFAHLGDIDCVMQVTILDGEHDQPWMVQVTFEELGVNEVRQVDESAQDRADFILETDLATWREMVESIVAGGGRPALTQTLNRLSMPGTPIRCWSVDPLRRDAYFRFNQTLQHFVDNAALLDTEWLEA